MPYRILVLLSTLLVPNFVLAVETDDVSIVLEVRESKEYRVVVSVSPVAAPLKVYRNPFSYAGVGLAPNGARIRVRNFSDETIECDDPVGRGYSSANMSSNLLFLSDKHEVLLSGETFSSPWYDIGELMKGFEHCAHKKSSEWNQFQINFTVNLSSEKINIKSGWHIFGENIF